tara:strand:+ start:131 stop:517 length:387 start_codon:yes stop_codon:yes gene_type:complete
MSVFDIRTYEVPLRLNISLGLTVLGFCFYNHSITNFVNMIIIILCFNIIIEIIEHILNKDILGGADRLVLSFLSLYLGFKGCFDVLYIASLLSGVVGIIIISVKGIKSQRYLPFLPFISIAYCWTMYL